MTDFETNSRSFEYRDGELFAESVPLKVIAETYGTPVYVYSKEAVLDAYTGYQNGLEGVPHLICYAVKANGNVAVMKMLAERGAGADLTSAGEMHLAKTAGIPPERMVFSGVGKTAQEIESALELGVLMFNVESSAELNVIASVAKKIGKTAHISVRVNPNVDAKTHPKISTGLKEHKFGVPWEECLALYERAASLDSIKIRGISAHIGSSLPDAQPLLDALDKILSLHAQLKEWGIEVPYVDIGGGLGIRYSQETPLSTKEFAQRLKEKIKDAGVTLIIEPGRSIMGNAGILLCETQYVKRTADRTFVIINAAMNDLARPAMYGAHHNISPISTGKPIETVDVVGPICESSDVFGKGLSLPQCEPNDLLAICSAGAYGFSMASQYNGRVRCAEVLVDGDTHRLVRRREELDELTRLQVY
ncbi:MAG: diaminopimelate decarboxylase [Candidatus Hinthialibacter antarcticus]|nr:diaminopimelate decarboxylase [Candidatus Hinthialibacter antarcticus]